MKLPSMVITTVLAGVVLSWPLGLVAAEDASPLADAVQRQDHAAVRSLLSGGNAQVDVNAPQADGATALAWAVHWDDLKTAEVLIHAGADVNAANELGMTPLMLASGNGSAPLVEMLVKAGADVSVARSTGETALIMAARTGIAPAVEILLGAGADVNAATRLGDTALMFSAAEQHPEVARVLIEHGAFVDARAVAPELPDSSRYRIDKARTTQRKAQPKLLQKNQAIAVGQLPKEGDDEPTRPEGGFTPLLHAVRAGAIETTRVLLAGGASIDQAGADGVTPLIVALVKHHEALALFLLDQGADPEGGDAGYTALHVASLTGQLAAVKALLAHGADPNARLELPLRMWAVFIPWNPKLHAGRLNHRGATPFMLATKGVDTRVMRVLVAAGADPLRTADEGTTAVMLAAGLGMRQATDMYKYIKYYTWDELRAVEAITLALELGVDVNAANELGETALHGATYHAAHDVIRFLSDQGAHVDATNWAEQTPLRLSQGHLYSGTFVRYPETEKLLRQMGADPAVGVRLNFTITAYVEDRLELEDQVVPATTSQQPQ